MRSPDDKITEEERDKLIEQIKTLYDNGVLRLKDLLHLYEFMRDICERDAAETLEKYLAESLQENLEDEESIQSGE